jgi:hypothetical protein
MAKREQAMRKTRMSERDKMRRGDMGGIVP